MLECSEHSYPSSAEKGVSFSDPSVSLFVMLVALDQDHQSLTRVNLVNLCTPPIGDRYRTPNSQVSYADITMTIRRYRARFRPVSLFTFFSGVVAGETFVRAPIYVSRLFVPDGWVSGGAEVEKNVEDGGYCVRPVPWGKRLDRAVTRLIRLCALCE